ncbi:thioesterase II family protein [Catenulispora subtropica]|uniref:thioesterase II family protein n=1 Tax=Catenulispora subtropica TaxID=450798 RepID=UPI0031D80DCE
MSPLRAFAAVTAAADTAAARAEASTRWLHLVRSGADAGAGAIAGRRLVFFPPAGASASSTYELAPAVPETWSVWGVQYPGRGPRLREAQASSIREIAAACFPDLADEADHTLLFGHSFGAYVAYEVAQILQKAGRSVAGLLVAGMPAPGSWQAPPADFTDAELVRSLTRIGGTAAELLADDEMLELLLPSLRSDLELSRAYVDGHAVPLRAPVLGLGGRDDALVPAGAVATWRHRTTAWLGAVAGDGDHFFYLQDPAVLADVLGRPWPGC